MSGIVNLNSIKEIENSIEKIEENEKTNFSEDIQNN